jgi:hypothetical protein
MFYKVIRWMSLLVTVTACLGCSVAAPVKTLPYVLYLEAYKASGELESTRSIDSTDPTYQRLLDLLSKEGVEWSRSVVSYRTGPFIIRGEGLIVRCYRDMLVVDILRHGESTSYKREIPDALGQLGLSR